MIKYNCKKCSKEFTKKIDCAKHAKNICIDNIIPVLNKKIEIKTDNNNISLSLNNNLLTMEEHNKDILKQKKGLKRNTIDKYYTKPSVVEQCIMLIKKYLNISKDDLIIEPSAGNGSFIENIKSLSEHCNFYDLEPENNNITKQDFLELDTLQFKKDYKQIHIIGNPPFGRQASLAIKFIKKCCVFSNSISFILPKSFKKDSMKKHFSNNFHMLYEIDLPDKSFLVNNSDCDVPCVFQIWQLNENEIRKKIIKIEPSGFKFVKKEDNPDISFRRVGVYAGIISKEIENKSVQSHYFIKFTNNFTIDQNIKKLKDIKFDFNNTVGPKSISKPELTNEFNKLIN